MGELTDLVAASFDAFGRKVARLEAERDALAAEIEWVKAVIAELLPYQERALKAEAKVAALEAAIRDYINGDDQRLGFNGLKAALAAETEAKQS